MAVAEPRHHATAEAQGVKPRLVAMAAWPAAWCADVCDRMQLSSRLRMARVAWLPWSTASLLRAQGLPTLSVDEMLGQLAATDFAELATEMTGLQVSGRARTDLLAM